MEVHPPSKLNCEKCEGTGLKIVSASFLDRIEETLVFCPHCSGTGRVPREPRERHFAAASASE